MTDDANIVPEAEVKRSVVAEEYSILRFHHCRLFSLHFARPVRVKLNLHCL
jgi:hypothetical protein